MTPDKKMRCDWCEQEAFWESRHLVLEHENYRTCQRHMYRVYNRAKAVQGNVAR